MGLFYHETACTAEKHLAEIEEALTRYTETMESTYRAAVRSQIIQAEQSLERHHPETRSPARLVKLVKLVKLAKPVRHARPAQPSRRRSRP